mgnify:CR=1 FL=1
MLNNILKPILKPILERNEVFKNKFYGKTCYIFGNGSSIKNIDFSYFTEHPTIAINHLVLHRDFHLLDVCAYTLPEPFSFYNFFKNPYSLKYEKNIMGNLFRSQIVNYPELNIFTSFTNIMSRGFKNTFYLHHFGRRNPNIHHVDPCLEFSFLGGGLHSAIGLAIHFGFEKAILVGCDYLMKPKSYGHFYSMPQFGKDDGVNPCNELLQSCSSKIKLEAISDYPVDSWLPCIDYESFSGARIKYRENNEIVSHENLLALHQAYQLGQHAGRVFSEESGIK